MVKNRQLGNQEIISMEEYLNKRRRIREIEEQKTGKSGSEDKKSSALFIAELYV